MEAAVLPAVYKNSSAIGCQCRSPPESGSRKSCPFHIRSSLKCDCSKQDERILLLVLRSKMLCRFTCISSYIKHYTWKNINLLGNSVKISVYIIVITNKYEGAKNLWNKDGAREKRKI